MREDPMGLLDGKVALVTGAGSGIGRATARAMAGEGAKVVAADIELARADETQREIEALGGAAAAVVCDVADEGAVEAAFDAAEEGFGPVNVLFNNAGICVVKDITETTFDEWRQTLAVNLGGVWNGSRTFINRARARGQGGAIVNSASVNAFYVEPDIAAYCASKAGVVGLTRALALDHGGQGIRINCVCPGYTETGMTGPMFDATPDPAGARADAGRLHALGRIASPDEIAQAVVFLASDRASFLTGAAVVADGGMSIGIRIV
jgi:NAD(P)-dependent dehydrogenase (short-subunit alcohol dehydrogenase family)